MCSSLLGAPVELVFAEFCPFRAARGSLPVTFTDDDFSALEVQATKGASAPSEEVLCLTDAPGPATDLALLGASL